MEIIHIKSKFDSEYRRFSIPINTEHMMSYIEFRSFIETVHSLHNIPFTLCYTSYAGDLLPITNDENFRKAFESSHPYLQLLIQRKGESWEEKYGYGTDLSDRRRKGISMLIPTSNARGSRRNYNISNPADFRQVSSIIDVHIIPPTYRRVRLCKYGNTDRSLGFYIREKTSSRITPQGLINYNSVIISRLLEGGLAESTGLLAVGDEVIEVNGIEVFGKTLDQVADMMVANAHNLIITIKPADQGNTLQRSSKNNAASARQQTGQIYNNQQQQYVKSDVSAFGSTGTKLNNNMEANGGGKKGSAGGRVWPTAVYQPQPAAQQRTSQYSNDFDDEDDEEEDQIIDHTNTALKIR